MPDIVLFPHCDLHVALNGTPQLTLKVAFRDLAPDRTSYTLEDVTDSCSFDFFAPYNAVGNRLQRFANIDPATGIVTPTAAGINLVQIRFGDHYIIARLQVHNDILGWWFGNASITTDRDSSFAHSQPSVYALFSDDATGADLVGDITGHGYVPLTSSNNAVFTVNAEGRLQGLQEGDATVSGTFLTKTHTLPVKVVDYGKQRNKLEYVQMPNVGQFQEMHNVLFISEGFRDTTADREKFDQIVTEVVEEMFSKPRHAPYNLLEGGFNIWKVYEPSQQHALTCGFRVNDEAVPNIMDAGYPIPASFGVSPDENIYTVELLIRIVGLPLRNEARTTAQLKALWGSQSLMRFDLATQVWVNNFNPNKVNDSLVAAWKKQRSLGILEARDTFFGLYLGGRCGDRDSGFSLNPLTRLPAAVLPPAADNPADANLAPFIERVYEWFTFTPSRTMTPDRRRHPPHLQAGNKHNVGISIMKYIGALRDRFAPHPNVGQEWVPDPFNITFKKSKGFIAMITNDGLIGGTNFNSLSITANTLARQGSLSFQYANAGNERIMRRTPSEEITEDIDDIIDTVAHEFGHSFNLGDEYEDFPGDQPNAFEGFDNIAVLSTINFDPNFLVNRQLNPDRVKWFELLRVELSNTLITDSETDGAQMKVTIDKRAIAHWVEAKKQNLEAYLRRIEIAPSGRQLPLKVGDSHYLVRLTIGTINEANGTIMLGGLEMPSPVPTFPAGSVLFVPKRDSANELMYVVEKKVLDKLKATRLPLNQDADTTKVNREEDDPVDIADFKPPCKAYKLIGVYEGASQFTGMLYRPAGLCKMRKGGDAGVGDGEFCHVCKYLIVQRVNPTFLDLLDRNYYPEAKKNG